MADDIFWCLSLLCHWPYCHATSCAITQAKSGDIGYWILARFKGNNTRRAPFVYTQQERAQKTKTKKRKSGCLELVLCGRELRERDAQIPRLVGAGERQVRVWGGANCAAWPIAYSNSHLQAEPHVLATGEPRRTEGIGRSQESDSQKVRHQKRASDETGRTT
jgi:hypothetical protein